MDMVEKVDLSKVKIVQIPILEDEWKLWRSICEDEKCSPKLKVRELIVDYIKTKMTQLPNLEEEKKVKEDGVKIGVKASN